MKGGGVDRTSSGWLAKNLHYAQNPSVGVLSEMAYFVNRAIGRCAGPFDLTLSR